MVILDINKSITVLPNLVKIYYYKKCSWFNQWDCQYSSDTGEKPDKYDAENGHEENGSSDKQKTGTNFFLT